MSITTEFAEYCTNLSYADIPPDVEAHAKKVVLDIVGNAIGGYTWMDSGQTFVRGVSRLNNGASGDATLLPTGDSLLPSHAALGNGALAHSLDYDNHHAAGVVHVGSSVVPATLAAGEMTDADGSDLLTAMVVGYDVTARLGMACNPFSSHNLGFHPTGTCGTFGATAAVGHLRGFDTPEFENAFGFNGSQASGSMQYDVNGAWNKRTHPGLAAQSAFVATAFVEEGLRGAARPIEGEDGFLQAYSSDPEPARATDKLGEEYELLNTAIKPYPLCRYTHLAIDLVLDIARNERVSPPEVERIDVKMPTYGVDLVGRPEETKARPQGTVDAQFSMPFAVALALTEKEVTLKTFSSRMEVGFNDEFRRLMDQTRVQSDDEIDAKHPEKWPAQVTVHTSNGSFERYGEQTKGEPGDPMTWEELHAKFVDLTPDLDTQVRDEIYETVRDIENRSAGELTRTFQ